MDKKEGCKKLQPVHVGHIPTREDVQDVQQLLMKVRVPAKAGHLLDKALPMPAPDHLPLEIVQSILEMAEYQPRARLTSHRVKADNYWPAAGLPTVAAMYLSTPRLPSDFVSASRITLQMTSSDDCFFKPPGGTYHDSDSWFEVSILRSRPGVLIRNPEKLDEAILFKHFRSPVGASAKRLLFDQGWEMVSYKGKCTWLVHRNRTCTGWFKDFNNYRVDWTADAPADAQPEEYHIGNGEGFLSALRPGDKIALWARSRSFEINVREALIELLYEEE